MGRKKKVQLITSLADLSETEKNLFNKQYVNAGHLRDEIDALEAKEPTDKRTKDYGQWVTDINFLYTLYNKKVGHRAYKTIDNVRKRVPKERDSGEQNEL